ncbi:MAG: putative peptidoglycan glycosyltransferase FtsW [Patescibacteria group bacterium]|jgi:cell division protein FtsW
MWRRLKKKLLMVRSGEHEPDTSLLTALGLLIVFGLVMLFSASSVVSYTKFGNTYHYFVSQLFSLGVGLVAFLVTMRVDYHRWKKFAGFFLGFSIFLLFLVFVPGLRADYGTARSWIVIFGYSFQTSELVKIFFLIYLATWLEARQSDLGNFMNSVVPFLTTLSVIGLLMIAQPNLGTLFIITFTSLVVFFVGGGRLTHLIFIILLGAAALSLMLVLRPSYQTDRFKCLQDLSFSPQDKCYQVSQSLIAVGSGGLFGRGLGASRQKFLYLPEVWADSIFPIIAEETGFVFSALLILLYLFIFYRGLLIARAAPDLYGSMLSIGIIVWFATQSFMNIGGMINLIPMTGVPLPFISAGGSAALSSLIAFGILINISKQTK